MKRLLLVWVMIPMLILSFALAEAPADHLGFMLLEQMYDEGQNLVLSPVSLSFSLGMAAEGAAGQTREEIQRLTSLHGENAAAMITGLSAKGIRIANAAFAAGDLPILENWRNTVTGAYAGAILTPPAFASSDSNVQRDFSEDLLSLADADTGKTGFVDNTGCWVIPPQYDKAASFSDGLALVEKGGKLMYIDHSGAVVWEER